MERFRRAGLELRRGKRPGPGEIPYAGEPSLKPTGVKGLLEGVNIADQTAYFNLSGFWLLKSATIRTDDDTSRVGWNRREMLYPAQLYLRSGLYLATWQDELYSILKSGEVNSYQSVSWHGEKYLEGEWCVISYTLTPGPTQYEDLYLRLIIEAEKLGEGRGLM